MAELDDKEQSFFAEDTTVTGIPETRNARSLIRLSNYQNQSLVNVELLGMKSWIRLDEDRLADHLLHLLEPLCAGSLELLDDLGVDAEHHVATVEVFLHLAHLDVDVIADRDGRLDH